MSSRKGGRRIEEFAGLGGEKSQPCLDVDHSDRSHHFHRVCGRHLFCLQKGIGATMASVSLSALELGPLETSSNRPTEQFSGPNSGITRAYFVSDKERRE